MEDAGSVDRDGSVDRVGGWEVGASNVGFGIPETRLKERVLMSKDVEIMLSRTLVWNVTSVDVETRNGTVKLMSASIGEEICLPDMMEEIVADAAVSMESRMARFGVKAFRMG